MRKKRKKRPEPDPAGIGVARAARPILGSTHPPVQPIDRSRAVVCLLILVVVATVAYANSFQGPFVLDDIRQVVKARVIKPPLSLSALLGSWRPTVMASLALNYAVGELEVFGYHVLNLLAHIVCGIVLFGFTRHTLLQPAFRERYQSHADYLALSAAILFLVHPIQTESVTYIYQRAEILGAIALLGGVWVAAAAAARRHIWNRVLLGLVAVEVFGMLSKETFVVLPALFALYDWCFIANGSLSALSRRWRLYYILGAFGLAAAVLAWSWQPVAAMSSVIGRWQYLSWQPGVVVYYARLILIPDQLCFDCGYFGPWPVARSLLGDMVWTPALMLASVGAAAWLARNHYPLVTFCIWGSAIVLAPTSSIFPVTDVYVEHRLYLPIALVAMLVVVVAFDASEAAIRKGWLAVRPVRAARLAGTVVLCAALTWLTHARNQVYANLVSLYSDSVAKAPESRRVRYNLAVNLSNLGNSHGRAQRWTKAMELYREAIRVDGDYSTEYFGERKNKLITSRAYVNLGFAYWNLGRYGEATEAWETARRLQPDLAIAHRHLAMAYSRSGESTKAITAAERAVTLAPGNMAGRKRLGELYAEAGRPDMALREYRAAARIKPGDQDLKRRIDALTVQMR